MKQIPSVRLHRFRDSVAVSVPGQETIYLSAALARQAAEELRRFAEDIERVPYSVSRLRAVDCQGAE